MNIPNYVINVILRSISRILAVSIIYIFILIYVHE